MLILSLVVVVTLLALPVLTYPLGRDQGEFATIGRGILDGRAPYSELWNPKPPAVFYVYALAMGVFGRTAMALRLLDLLFMPLVMCGLYWLGMRIASWRVGLWAALVFAVFYFTETFWTLTQNDGLALAPMTLGMLAMFETVEHSGRRRALWWALAAGTLSALALWFKYPFVLFVGALVGGYVLQGRAAASQTVRREIASFVAGGLAVGLGGIAFLAAIGSLDALLESARVTRSYTTLTYNIDDFTALMRTSLGFRWQQWWLLFILAALWLPLARFPGGTRRRAPWQTVGLWALAGLGIMLVQARGFDYHWLPMLPPLALLAGDSLDRLTCVLAGLTNNFAESRQPIVSRMVGTLVASGLLLYMALGIWPRALPYLTGQETRVEYYGRFQAGEFVADESLEMAAYLRERVAPGDSLYIWGFRPEVYYLAGLKPATRFIFQFPLAADWYPIEWQQENVDVLWAALPPYALVLQADYMPFVTGRDEDSHELLVEYTELSNWLSFNYERQTQIGNFIVWQRKS